MKKFIIASTLLALANTASAADLVKGKEIFLQRCAMCHGNEGKGDGVAAAAFPAEAKPRNLATDSLKFAVDETKFKKLLSDGGAGVGLSPMMPPQVGLSDTDLAGLYAFIKSLKK